MKLPPLLVTLVLPRLRSLIGLSFRSDVLRSRLRAIPVLGLLFMLLLGGFTPTPANAAASSIAVSGTSLVNGFGTPVRILGVNRTGTEYSCQSGGGIFSGPVDQAQMNLLRSWKVNAVRIPLNEHCWLGTAGESATTGAAYRAAIVDYVTRLNANDMYAILDLHFTSPFGAFAEQRRVMANRQYSVPFWSSVARTFAPNRAVLFELYNEPQGIDWPCWLNGCIAEGYQTAGMQELVTAVRAAGAVQPIILNGIDWGHDMRGLLANLPRDPAGQLVAGQHLYNFKRCVSTACWNAEFAPVAAVMPVVAPEVGVDDCSTGLVTNFMNWMDANGGDGYAFWAFNAGPCPEGVQFGGSALISDWSGTPSLYGDAVRSHFLSVAPTDPVVTTPPPVTAPPATLPPSTTPPGTSPTTPGTPPVTTSRPPASPAGNPGSTRPDGYRLVTSDGRVFTYGALTTGPDAPAGFDAVATAGTPDGRGYWVVSRSGAVFAAGTAAFYGDMAGKRLNAPIVGIAAVPNGTGYWLLGRDGGIFSFGPGAAFYGSTGNLKLNAPVVGMTAVPDGNGYWFVASDGGIFSYGSARFYGSTGNIRLNQPVVGMASTPSGNGYWLVASDGGIFSFGPSAPFYGSTGNLRLNAPIIGMATSSAGDGYRFVASDGGVFSYGNASFYGSLANSGFGAAVRAIS